MLLNYLLIFISDSRPALWTVTVKSLLLFELYTVNYFTVAVSIILIHYEAKSNIIKERESIQILFHHNSSVSSAFSIAILNGTCFFFENSELNSGSRVLLTIMCLLYYVCTYYIQSSLIFFFCLISFFVFPYMSVLENCFMSSIFLMCSNWQYYKDILLF